MKGLLIKDFCLLKNQKRLLPIFALLAVWFTVLHTDGFAFPFLGMMSTILTASTVSYDELDRCQTALFTLPFERRTYVAEKYVLGAILLAGAMVLGGVCTAARQLFVHDVALESIGMIVEAFGAQDVAVRTIPMVLGEAQTKDFVRDVIAELENGRDPTFEKKRTALLQTACKHAVKGGEALTEDELRSLLDTMIEQKVTPTCPHGRPLVVAISHRELDKKFKRIQK